MSKRQNPYWVWTERRRGKTREGGRRVKGDGRGGGGRCKEGREKGNGRGEGGMG